MFAPINTHVHDVTTANDMHTREKRVIVVSGED